VPKAQQKPGSGGFILHFLSVKKETQHPNLTVSKGLSPQSLTIVLSLCFKLSNASVQPSSRYPGDSAGEWAYTCMPCCSCTSCSGICLIVLFQHAVSLPVLLGFAAVGKIYSLINLLGGY